MKKLSRAFPAITEQSLQLFNGYSTERKRKRRKKKRKKIRLLPRRLLLGDLIYASQGSFSFRKCHPSTGWQKPEEALWVSFDLCNEGSTGKYLSPKFRPLPPPLPGETVSLLLSALSACLSNRKNVHLTPLLCSLEKHSQNVRMCVWVSGSVHVKSTTPAFICS